MYTFQCTQVSIALCVCDKDSFTCLCVYNVYCNNDDGVFEFVKIVMSLLMSIHKSLIVVVCVIINISFTVD